MAAQYEEKKLSEFLETFPNHHMKPESIYGPWFFWSEDEEEEEEGSQNNSSSGESVNYTATNRMIYNKIKSVFSVRRYYCDSLVLQFWVPVTIGGRRLLSTFGQPFVVSRLDKSLAKYRLLSMEYLYNIDETNNNLDIQHHPAAIIISGAASNAFLNRFPERVDFKQQRILLDHYVYGCELTTSYMLPICCPSQSSSSCVGVVECSTKTTYLSLLKSIVTALEKVGLSVFDVQESIPYKNINGLKPVKDEIKEALKIVCESHNIGLAQVWISYEDESHVPFSSSSLEDTRKKRMLALKLTGYIVDEDSIAFQDSFQYCYYVCDMFPLHSGVELVDKTFQDYEPRYCKNMFNLRNDMLMACAADYDDYTSSALVICLRSINTGHINYVFEFIWVHNSKYLIFLVALLLTLKRCLPSFKLASGAELGDELHVIDIDNSSTSENQIFKIFQEKKVPPIPEASEKGKKQMVEDYIEHLEGKSKTAEIRLSREVIEEQFGKTQKEAAKNLNVHESTLKRKCRRLGIKNWPGPDVVKKRKVNDLHNNQSKTNEKGNGAIQDPLTINRNEDTLTIKAEYGDDIIKFRLRISETTFQTVEMEIGMQFNVNIGTFKLNYLDEEEEWILLKSDQHMSDCIESWRNSDRTVVRLRVLPTV